MNEPETYMSSREAEAYTGLKALKKRRVDGTSPPYIKAGRRVIYARSVIDGWMRERIRTRTSHKGALSEK